MRCRHSRRRRATTLGGSPISAQAVGDVLRRRMALAHLATDGYSPHSLRTGYATEAARRGVASWRTGRHTRHRSTATVEAYIRDAERLTQHPTLAIFADDTGDTGGR